ncbi:hypothetical protein D9756_005730 [Leucocoprinus leucothites]|uniref:CFEM domain-containing protein n=1 Tax=Leucocoprinus leucothites TaxID=201217 RepID=A0A8H5FZ83_9AGAR|nr:hypothetical protein D9756_005730 [Leucoagaricus leucothites]
MSIMFVRLVVTGFLWSTFAFRSALAQGGNLGQLPTCAQTCVAAVAQSRNCVLTTPQCLCPGQVDIDNCINQSCPISDLAATHAIIGQFCLGVISPTPPSTTSPVTTTPTVTTTTTTNPGTRPLTTTTSLTSAIIPSLPTTTLSSSSTTTSSSSLTIPSSTSSNSTTLVVPPTSLTLPTTQPHQTVVMFSTQFAPPMSTNAGSSFRDCVGWSAVVAFFISVVISGVVGIHGV